MTDTRQHPAERQLTDLALLDVDEAQSESLNRHLATCRQCRGEYEDILDVVAHVSAATPPASLPVGFTDRVLAALSHERSDREEALRDVEVRTRVRRVRSRRRRAWYGVAAGIAVGIAVGAGGAVVLLERDDASKAVTALGTPLVTSEGTRVGTILESRFDGGPVLVMTVTGGDVGARYDCEVVLANGRREPAGSWVMRESAGATWVVPRPGDDAVIRVELLRDGSTWATATL